MWWHSRFGNFPDAAIDRRAELRFIACCARRGAAVCHSFCPGHYNNMHDPAHPSPRRLPFTFAKRHGVLFDGLRLQARRGASLNALHEAQRFVGSGLACDWLDAPAFEQALSDAYQHDSSAAMQMVEGFEAQTVRVFENRCRKPKTCWSRKTTRRSSA